jgi:two-component sensor histidine kinase
MSDTVSVVWRNRSASEGIFEGEGILGYSILSGYATSALSDWMLIVTAPKSLIYREVLNNLLQTILAIIMALGTTIYIAWYVGNRSRSSASALLLSAQNLKDGEPIVWTDNDVLEFDKVGRALLNAASELRAREQRNSEMLLELSHRTKNLLAVIQSMAKQAAKSATSVEKFSIEFSDRLFALSRCHDLLIASEWQSVCLSSLVQSQVIPVIGEQVKQIKINGPVILLSSAAAQTFAIALHELTTNSIKYGALGTEDGSVEISWDVSDQTLNFKWDEKTQNDSARLLDKQGFGTVVLLRTTPAGLSGTSMQEIFKGGYLWQVSAPLRAISAEQVAA